MLKFSLNITNMGLRSNFMTNEFEEINIMEKIRQLCTKKGWSVYKLAKESGIPYSSLNNMFNRNTQPTVTTLYKLCSGLNISLSDFFLDVDTHVIPLNPETREMLERYNKLPPSKQGMVRAYIMGLCDDELSH